MTALYRVHPRHYLNGLTGSFANPNLNRERKPRDMPMFLHIAIGEWFKNKFGINYRSQSLFCTGDIGIARGYLTNGNVLITLAPVGHYSICFSPKCKDLFGHFQFDGRGNIENISSVGGILEDLNFAEFKDSGIDMSAASGNEVMIFAEKFTYKIHQ